MRDRDALNGLKADRGLRVISNQVTRAEMITLGAMRSSGIRGLLIYCADYKCAHSIAMSAAQWPDNTRLSDLEPLFVCRVCGHRDADIRADPRTY